MAPMLCPICRNIQFHRIPPFPKSFEMKETYLGSGLCFLDLQQWRIERPDIFGLQHHQDLISLENSAKSCTICSLFHAQVQKFLHSAHHGKRVGNNGALYPDVKPKRYRFQITRRASRDGLVIWTDDGPNERIWYIAIIGFAVQDETDPLAQIFAGRAIISDPSVPKALDRAFEWVSNCNYHQNCSPKPADTLSPTRLLDVGQSASDPIKLCETKGTRGFYTTLSYVWGKTKQLTTTTGLYETHKAGLPVDKFPRTMQNAFIVTRKMGIRYIWIDALCIIQDDPQDWQREAAQMGSVYANSYLTISAAGASDNIEGCFIARQRPEYTTFDCKCDHRSGQLSLYPVPIEEGPSQTDAVHMREEPISDRGWCFQERVLSRRTLFYAKDQMYFECKEHFLGEDGMNNEGRYLSIYQPYSAIPSSGQVVNTMRDLWDELVEGYSRRSLTKPSDKLPAMSGLAERFAHTLGDVYLAGLWKSTLLSELLWCGSYNAPWPPGDYRAPSWSWAAVNGSERPLTRYREQVGHSQFQRVANIISSEVKIEGVNPYGEVSDGRIVIQAPLVPIHVTKDFTGDPDGTREAHGYFGFITQFEVALQYACMDYKIDFETIRTLQVFALLIGRDAAVACYPSLLVIPVSIGIGGLTQFRRIGFIKLEEAKLGSGIPRWGIVYPLVTLI